MEKRVQEESAECHKKGWMHRMGHGWMMALCCLLPIGAAFAVQAAGYGSAAGYMMLLLCPVMHLFMMKSMHKKGQRKISAAETGTGDIETGM
jgi:uncharacterized membrane protein